MTESNWITINPASISWTVSDKTDSQWYNLVISKRLEPKPINVVFSGLTTIVFFDDGTKEMVRCGENDVYDREHAVAMCLAHKQMGSKSKFKKFVKKGHVQLTPEEEEERKRIKKERNEFDEFPF